MNIVYGDDKLVCQSSLLETKQLHNQMKYNTRKFQVDL